MKKSEEILKQKFGGYIGEKFVYITDKKLLLEAMEEYLNQYTTCIAFMNRNSEPREYTHPVNGDLMTLSEFERCVDCGDLIEDDGMGYWVKDGKECKDHDVFTTYSEDATHVSWYNK